MSFGRSQREGLSIAGPTDPHMAGPRASGPQPLPHRQPASGWAMAGNPGFVRPSYSVAAPGRGPPMRPAFVQAVGGRGQGTRGATADHQLRHPGQQLPLSTMSIKVVHTYGEQRKAGLPVQNQSDSVRLAHDSLQCNQWTSASVVAL